MDQGMRGQRWQAAIVTRWRIAVPVAWVAALAIFFLPWLGRVEPAAYPWALAFSGLMAAGLAAGLVAVLKGRPIAGWAGLLAWLPLPILHRLAIDVVREGWAPTFFADVVGLGVGLVMAVVAVVFAFPDPVPGSAWWRIERGESAPSRTRPRRRTPSSKLVRIAGVGALAMGLIVMVWPRTYLDQVGWRLDDTDPVTAGAFQIRVVLAEGRIEATGGATLAGGRFDAGTPFVLHGAIGTGPATVTAVAGDGTVLVDMDLAAGSIVPPDVASPDEAVPADVYLFTDPDPARMAPGAPVAARFGVENVGGSGDLTLIRFGVEPLSIDAPDLLPGGAADACRVVAADLPVRIPPREQWSCTFDIPVGSTAGKEDTYSAQAEFAELSAITYSSNPVTVLVIDGGGVTAGYPPAREIPPPPVAAPVVEGRPQVIGGSITTRGAGPTVITITSPEGSPGLNLGISGEHRHLAVPAARFGVSLAVGALWLAAGGALLTVPQRRSGAALLLGAAVAMPFFLWAGGTHAWYWSAPHIPLGLGAMIGAGLGGWLAVPAGPTPVRVLGGLVLALTGVVALGALGLGAAADSYVGDPRSWRGFDDYHGDYLVMGWHLLAVTLGVILAGTGGGLIGSDRTTTVPPEPAPRVKPPTVVGVVVAALGLIGGLGSCGDSGGGTALPMEATTAATTTTSTEPPATATTATTTTSTVPATTSPLANTTTTTTTVPAPTEGVPAHLAVYRYGDFGVVRASGGETEVILDDAVQWLADDLMGGILVAGGALPWEPLHWKPIGAALADPVAGVPPWSSLTPVDGRPHLVFWREVPTEGGVDYDVYLVRRDLIAGTERVSAQPVGYTGDAGGLVPSTAGGRLVAGVGFASVGAGGTDLALHLWDMDGRPVSVAANPFPEPCWPCELNVLLSPDGDRLVYRHRPTAKWPAPETDHLSYDEWFDVTVGIDADLVVLDLETGAELFRTAVGAGDRLFDYDGRYVVVVDHRAPGVRSTVIDSWGEHPAAVMGGEVKLVQPQAGWPVLNGCSVAGIAGVADPAPPLPAPVAATRDAIVAAAMACDVHALAVLADAAPWFEYAFGSARGPAELWTREEQAGEPVLRRLVQLLDTPYAVEHAGSSEETFVWPYLDVAPHVGDDDWAVLEGIYTATEIARLRAHEDGGYLGFRIHILADGSWVQAVGGD